MNILLAKGVLPNSTSVLPHHGLALLAAECFLEFRHVGNHSVHPGLRRRVRIRLCHHAQVLGSRVRTPSFSIRNEESLLRVNPFLSGRLSFSERVLSRPSTQSATRHCLRYFPRASTCHSALCPQRPQSPSIHRRCIVLSGQIPCRPPPSTNREDYPHHDSAFEG